MTERAAIDALLIARADHQDDVESLEIVLKHCDPYAVVMQLSNRLRTMIGMALRAGACERLGHRTVEDVIDFWLALEREHGEDGEHREDEHGDDDE